MRRIILGLVAVDLLLVGALLGIAATRPSLNIPMDTTGRTTIIVDQANGDWCELRGPGRFQFIDDYMRAVPLAEEYSQILNTDYPAIDLIDTSAGNLLSEDI